MKKRILRILLIIALFGVGVVIIVGINVYNEVMGDEELTGSTGTIPEKLNNSNDIFTGTSDFSQWRGKDFKGKSSVTNIITDWSNGLQKLWEVDYFCQGSDAVTWSAPVVQGNSIIVPGRNGDNDIIFCIDAISGQLIWQYEYFAETGSSHGAGARATPFIDNDRVYSYSRGGHLLCLGMKNGEKLWAQNLIELGGEEPRWGYSGSPLVDEDMVLVQGGGSIQTAAFHKMTGELLWKTGQGLAGYSPVIPYQSSGKTFYLSFHGTGLSLLNKMDGKEFWKIPWETNYGVNVNVPVVSGNRVMMCSGYGMGSQMVKINTDKPEIIWTNKEFAPQHSDPVLLDGYLYGYSGASSQNKGSFQCIEFSTGKEQWSTNEIGWGTTIYADGYLVCLDIKGNLYLVKPEPDKFIKISDFPNAIPKVKNRAWTPPVIANGKLYLRYMQRLICYRLEDFK